MIFRKNHHQQMKFILVFDTLLRGLRSVQSVACFFPLASVQSLLQPYNLFLLLQVHRLCFVEAVQSRRVTLVLCVVSLLIKSNAYSIV